MALNRLPYYALLFKLQLRCVLLFNVQYCNVPVGDLFEMCMVVPTYNLLRCRYRFDDNISDKR